jgi:crotonobetainyl-CoA:carnitine CoA-transferase CaiB-like acyl-CoA transferase
MQVAVEHDIALGPALRFDEIQTDPHLQAREQVVTEHHPVYGHILTSGNPIVVPGKALTIHRHRRLATTATRCWPSWVTMRAPGRSCGPTESCDTANRKSGG